MSACRRIVIDLPNDLAGELENLAQAEQASHEELLCKAVQSYIEDCKHRNIVEQMKKGYKEMGSINITIAEEGLYGGISKR